MSPLPKRALITGITGQDGSYLAEFLLAKGYEVHGIKRRASSFNTERIDHLYQDPHQTRAQLRPALRRHGGLHQPDPHRRDRCSPTRSTISLRRATSRCPSRCPSTPPKSWRRHAAPARSAPHHAASRRRARFYQASTSELYGKVPETPQRETTPFHPRSPYGVAKLFAYWICVNYREAYGMFACNGILFNHESPVRGETFVSRKITRARGAHQGRPAGRALSRQPGRQARLGPRQGLRRSAVADPAAGPARRLRHRHRRAALRPRIHRTGLPRSWVSSSNGRGRGRRDRRRASPQAAAHRGRGRPALLPSRRSRYPARRPVPRHAELGWRPKYTFEQLVAEMVRCRSEAGANATRSISHHGFAVTSGHQE